MGAFGGYWSHVEKEDEMSMMIEWYGQIDYSVWNYQKRVKYERSCRRLPWQLFFLLNKTLVIDGHQGQSFVYELLCGYYSPMYFPSSKSSAVNP